MEVFKFKLIKTSKLQNTKLSYQWFWNMYAR